MKEQGIASIALAAICTSVALGAQTQLGNLNVTPAGDRTSTLGASVQAGSKLYFGANDKLAGAELYLADVAGVRRVLDLVPGSSGSGATPLAAWQGDVLFGAQDGTRSGLWRSDGTAAGTRFLAAMPKTQSGAVLYGGSMLFVASDGSAASSVWSTDGTAAGTRLLATLASPAVTGPAAAAYVLPNAVVFLMQNGQIVTSDGSAAGPDARPQHSLG